MKEDKTVANGKTRLKPKSTKRQRRVNVWKKGRPLEELVSLYAVTLVVGGPGSGKSEATSVLANLVNTSGGAVHVVDRDYRLAKPVQEGEIDHPLSESVQKASDGDLVIGREVFECDQIDFRSLTSLARKRRVTVVIEMQSADLDSVRDHGCDILVMRSRLLEYQMKNLTGLGAKEIAQINAFQPGEGVFLSERAVKPRPSGRGYKAQPR